MTMSMRGGANTIINMLKGFLRFYVHLWVTVRADSLSPVSTMVDIYKQNEECKQLDKSDKKEWHIYVFVHTNSFSHEKVSGI